MTKEQEGLKGLFLSENQKLIYTYFMNTFRTYSNIKIDDVDNFIDDKSEEIKNNLLVDVENVCKVVKKDLKTITKY